MRKRLLLASMTALITVGLLAPAAASVKTGTVCKKFGATTISGGIKYTCLKSGKKLVWSKGIKTSTPQPLVTKTSAPVRPGSKPFVPWSEAFTYDELLARVESGYSTWLSQLSDIRIPHQLVVDPKVGPESVAFISAVDTLLSYTFDRFIMQPTYSFVGETCKAISDTMATYTAEQIRRTVTTCDNAPAGNPEFVHNSFNAIGYAPNGLGNPTTRRMNQLAMTFGHEYMHNVQSKLAGGTVSHYLHLTAPRWLLEGSATYFGYNNACRALKRDCILNDSLAYSYQPAAATNILRDYESNVDPRKSKGPYPYDIGYAAIQYLSGSTGPAAVLEIFANLGEGQEWPKAFESAVGLSIDSFYAKFERVRSNLRLAQPTMRLVNGINQPIP